MFEIATKGKVLYEEKDGFLRFKLKASSTYQDYVKDLLPKYAVERLIHLIVDLALDINNIILSYLKKFLYSPA